MEEKRRKIGKKTGQQVKKGTTQVFVNILRWSYLSVFTLVTIALLLVFLLSAFSDHVDPRTFRYLAFLGIGFHLVFYAVLLWLVVLLVLRHWRLSLAVVVCLLISYEPITRYFPLHFSGNAPIIYNVREGESADDIQTLRLLSYNTCGMGQVHLSKIDEKIPVLDIVRESNADIVCLQEYAFTLSKGGHTQQQIRQSLADLYPYYDFMPNSGRDAYGIAFFSKFPIKNMTRIDKSKKNYVASMFYELDINGKRVVLLNNHLFSNQIDKHDRVLYEEMIEHFAADSLERIKTGMLRSLGRGFLSRAAQANQIRDFLKDRLGAKASDTPTIICGDMNDTPISYCYRTMRGDLNDAWQGAGFGAGTTYNRHHMWFRIDHIFHSRHFHPLEAKVLSQ